MDISDVSMHRKTELVRRGSTERLGVGKATRGEVFWRADWVSPVATATTIQNHAPKRGWSFRAVLVSTGNHHNSGKLR
jgi:hypothetical protein